jgi:hypothetical protein
MPSVKAALRRWCLFFGIVMTIPCGAAMFCCGCNTTPQPPPQPGALPVQAQSVGEVAGDLARWVTAPIWAPIAIATEPPDLERERIKAERARARAVSKAAPPMLIYKAGDKKVSTSSPEVLTPKKQRP